MPEPKSKHAYDDHPSVGLLACVKAYQQGPRAVLAFLKSITSPGAAQTHGGKLFLEDGQCRGCGFDEAWHGLKEGDYAGKEDNPVRVRLLLEAAEAEQTPK